MRFPGTSATPSLGRSSALARGEDLWASVDAHKSSPRASADERPKLGVAEVPGKRITAGTGKHVDDHCLGTKDRADRRGEILAFAGHPVVLQRTAQIIDHIVRSR